MTAESDKSTAAYMHGNDAVTTEFPTIGTCMNKLLNEIRQEHNDYHLQLHC